MNKKNFQSKKAQEELIGFGVIVVLVAVILLFFLAFSLKNSSKENVGSYEVNSFIQSFLQYTTDCSKNYETDYLPIQKVIFGCANDEKCFDEKDMCGILDSESKRIIGQSWEVGENKSIKGYELKINSESEEILKLKKGNITQNYKTGVQDFSKSGSLVEVLFTIYY